MDQATGENVLIPLIGVICVFGLPVLAFIIHRVLVHQERMEMLRHGIVPPPNRSEARRARWFAENGGWAPPSDISSQNAAYGYESIMAAQRQLRRGLNLAMIGLALVIGLSFIDSGHLGPWLLGGLVPLFAGIAQIAIAVMSGAHFGVPRVPSPSSSGPAPGAPPTPSPGPYAYRPGSTAELEPPVPPPDIKR